MKNHKELIAYFSILLECSHRGSLGMEDGRILKQQLTVSSEWNRYHGANNARLNFIPSKPLSGGWSAETNNQDQFLQVDFGRNVKVSAVATQGRQDMDQWVKEYKLAYIEEGKPFTFETYKEDAQEKVKRNKK